MMNISYYLRILKNKQSGMALPLVLVFSAAVLAFGAALLNYSFNESCIASYYSQDIKKYYLAESGLETGYAILQDNFYYQGKISGSLDEGTFNVTFFNVGSNRRLIVSEGVHGGFSLQVRMLVENDPEQGPVIIQWFGE